MEKEKYFWVIGGGEMQIPVIEEARSLGLKVICSDNNPGCVCASIADVFFEIDIFDIRGHINAINNFKNVRGIVGVLAAGIDAPETMACIAQELGLPGVSPDLARLVHNKADFRKRMLELGFPVPKFIAINQNNIHQINEFARDIGYPLIVKNSDSSGSRGTKIFYQPNDNILLHSVATAIEVSPSKTALIESFLVGPEQTVETLFDIDGNFHKCFITDRKFDKSTGYAIETDLRHPSTLPIHIQNELYKLAYDISKALGIKIGAAKFDSILTPDGPRIIEMTVRLSGGFDCQYLVPAATGKNIIRAAILTALGLRFDDALLSDQKNRIAISWSLWPKPGRITSIKGLEQARSIPGVSKIIMRKKVGDLVEPYTDCTKRTCFIIASAASTYELDELKDIVNETLIIDVEAI